MHHFMTYTYAGEKVSILNPEPLESSPRFPLEEPLFEPPPPPPTPIPVSDMSKQATGGERRYGCTECDKVFTTSGHLTRHRKMHSGEKDQICPFPGCNKRCSRHDNLLQHYRMHVPKADRQLKGNGHIREALARMKESLDDSAVQSHAFFPKAKSVSSSTASSSSPAPVYRSTVRHSPHTSSSLRRPDPPSSPTTSASLSPITPSLPFARSSPVQHPIQPCPVEQKQHQFTASESVGYSLGFAESYVRRQEFRQKEG